MTPLYDRKETQLLRRLATPQKIQDYLDSLPINFERHGETLMSPRRVMREKTAHCMEGALFAAAALQFHGQRPLLLDLLADDTDQDHVVALFSQHGAWGAISKTNHAVLRYREPIYKTIRELVLSFFHEYFRHSGKKTLRKFSKPIDISKFNKKTWQTDEKNLWYLNEYLDSVPHYSLLHNQQLRTLRLAHKLEIAAGKLVEWPEPKRS
jgi:hypothetical protein